MLFNLLTQREEFRLHLSYRESYLFTNQSFCSSKRCFIFILTFSQYSDTLLSGDGHWENIFCERKATQWPSRSWTWNFHPAVRATKNTNSDTARPWSIGKMATTDWNGLECVAAYGLYIWVMVNESRSRPLDRSISQNYYYKLSLTKIN